MSKKYPHGHYVYIHVRKTDGKIFYVGKGQGRRAWRFRGESRNEWWHKTNNKYGTRVIVYKDNMTHQDALTLEMFLISIYRELKFPIVNISSGGEGNLGVTPHNVRDIRCSNGMVFKSAQHAVDWVSTQIGVHIKDGSSITMCCNRQILSSYGYSWWYDGDEPIEYVDTNVRKGISNGKTVYCSNGMRFYSAESAARWLHSKGVNASGGGHIISCCEGRLNQAYGFKWSYNEINYDVGYIKPYRTPVTSSFGESFHCISSARDWLRKNGFPNASESAICRSIKHKHMKAYGRLWCKGDVYSSEQMSLFV